MDWCIIDSMRVTGRVCVGCDEVWGASKWILKPLFKEERTINRFISGVRVKGL